MNLEEATKVLDSLQELEPNVEDFSWGPTLHFAQARQKEAIKILKKYIKELKHQKKKNEAGCGPMDSLEKCEQCGKETFVWRMAGGGECTNPDCSHAEICF